MFHDHLVPMMLTVQQPKQSVFEKSVYVAVRVDM